MRLFGQAFKPQGCFCKSILTDMKRVFTLFASFLCAASLFAQAPAAEEAAPSPWTKGIVTSIGFSQLSLTNWAAGGSGSIALNTFIDTYADYEKGKIIWFNELQMGYGFIESFDDTGFKKSDDRLIFDSKWGYKATDKLYFSSVFNLRSQFADGYTKDVLTSSFFAPANVSLGLGIDYQPAKNISVNFAPLTGKVVMVAIEDLRPNYGFKEEELSHFSRFELGAQLKVDTKLAVKDFTVGSHLTLFSDYLDNPLDVKVNWDVNADAKISKYFSVSLRTSLLYDSRIKSVLVRDKRTREPILDENGKEQFKAGVQFKELFSVGFSYTFGQTKKKK